MSTTRARSLPGLLFNSVLFLATALSWDSCFATGFNCSKATGIERRICGDYQLSNLDLELNVAYKLTRMSDRHTQEQIAQQRQWVTDERNRCADKTCLVHAYQLRIGLLQSEILKKPSQCGIGEAEIRGRWQGLNESQFEELEIAASSEERRFSSWLHSRPEYDGSWLFKNCKLHLDDAAASHLVFDYVVYGIADGVLYLKRTGREETSLYRKLRN